MLIIIDLLVHNCDFDGDAWELLRIFSFAHEHMCKLNNINFFYLPYKYKILIKAS